MDDSTRSRVTSDSNSTGFTILKLKVVGILLMSMSVVGSTLVPKFFGEPTAENVASLTISVLFEIISWCAIPLYSWFLVLGFIATVNRGLYGLRLFILAIICEVPYDRVTSGRFFDLSSQNPVFGLVIALIVLSLLELVMKYKGIVRWLLMFWIVVAGILWNLVGRVGVRQHVMMIGLLTLGFVLCFYYLRAHENTMMFTAGLLGAVSLVTPGIGVAVMHYCNGNLGYSHSRTKWIFYGLYPLVLFAGALVNP